MKRLFAFLFVLILVTYAHMSKADVQILPVCVVHGPIYLEVQPQTVRGMIGTEKVLLDRDGGHYYGQIRGLRADLSLYRGNIVRGHVGENQVSWRIAERGDVIYGFEFCISE